ncbi:MAG: LLM class flavin-dependent oxidoreductase [Acidimicrobiia bacterium]
MKLGISLPVLQPDPAVVLGLARDCDAHVAVDGVFVFEHLFRARVDGTRRSALDCFPLLGALAAATTRVQIGTLVARATLRPAAVLANMFATVQRISNGRLIAGLGSGDAQSQPEMDALGLGYRSESARVQALADAIDACRAGSAPIWVGGRSRAVRGLAAQTDGWNAWGGSAEQFRAHAQAMRRASGRNDFCVSWGGTVCVAPTEEAARAKAAAYRVGPDCIVGSPTQVVDALLAWGDLGADWVVVADLEPATGIALLVEEWARR